MNANARALTYRGAVLNGTLREAPAALEDVAEAPPVLVDAAPPEPWVAVPVDCPPEFWEPFPCRPIPFPAPDFIMAAAADGMAGRESPSTFQLADLVGHPEAPPVELYPPSPVGLAVALNAETRLVKSERGVTVEPEMVTRPYLLSSWEYS